MLPALFTAVFFGASSREWEGQRALSELGLDLWVRVLDCRARADLFIVAPDTPSAMAGSARLGPAACSSYSTAIAELAGMVQANASHVNAVFPIGAVQWDSRFDAPRAQTFSAVRLNEDTLFSRIDAAPTTSGPDQPSWPLDAARHTFLEADIDERAPDDLTIVERELKLDASADPRTVGWKLNFGDGGAVFSGTPVPDVHYHRVHNVGQSGLFEMTTDPALGPQLLKYKYELAGPDEAIYRRFEVVEPATVDNFDRAARHLAPGIDVSCIAVTPYFDRNRVKTNVYVAGSRSVFEVFADHSQFMEGPYKPFDQVEIEYVGTIGRVGTTVNWGRGNTPHLEAEFAQIERLVVAGYAKAGVVLTRSRRRKYDWAVTEVFSSKR